MVKLFQKWGLTHPYNEARESTLFSLLVSLCSLHVTFFRYIVLLYEYLPSSHILVISKVDGYALVTFDYNVLFDKVVSAFEKGNACSKLVTKRLIVVLKNKNGSFSLKNIRYYFLKDTMNYIPLNLYEEKSTPQHAFSY